MSKSKIKQINKTDQMLRKSFSDCIDLFYEQKAYYIVNGFQRNKLLSFILLVSKNIQFVLLFLSRSNLSKIIKKDSNFQFLYGWSFIVDLVDGKNQAQQILILLLALNILIITSLIAQIALFVKDNINQLKVASFTEQCKLSYEKQKKQKSQRVVFIKEAISCIYSVYQYIFFVPSTYVSVASQSHTQNYTNLVFSLLLEQMQDSSNQQNKKYKIYVSFLQLYIYNFNKKGLVSVELDFNYNIQAQEYLQKKYSLRIVLNVFIEFLATILIACFPDKSIIILILYFGVQVYIQIQSDYLINPHAQRFNNFIQLTSFIITIYLGLEFYIDRPLFLDSIFLILLLITCFSWKFADILQNRIQSDLIMNISNKNEISIKQLDNTIRLNFFETGDCSDKMSISLLSWVANLNNEHEKNEEILKNNKIQVEQQLLLFHQKLKNLNKASKSDILENYSHPRQLIQDKEIEQIVQIIGNRFRDILETEKIKQNQQSDCQILYLIYILEIQKNFKLFLLQYYQILQNKKQLNIKRRQILQTLFIRFQDYLQQFMQQNNCQENIFSMKYFNFILYDETINENKELFSQAVCLKKEILCKMQMKIIDINHLSIQIKGFLERKKKLEETIILLSKLNMKNKEFQFILNQFSQCLAFDNKEISKLKKKILVQQKLEIPQKDLANQVDSQSYSDSCVIFTSLLNNEGRHVIKKTSSNFQDVFGIKCKSAVHKPIEQLMPDIFKQYHSIYIKDFMERNIKFNYQIQNISFAKNNSNYIFPCNLTLKINSLDSISDFGITAQIKIINKHKDYILFNSTTMRIISITQPLHKVIFKHFKQLENIILNQYFPFLQEAINPTGRLFSQSLSSFSLSSAEENLQTGSSQEEESFEQNAYLNKPIQFIFLELIDRYFYHSNLQKKELLNNLEFYLMEIVVKKAQYKYINNLYYIEISQIQLLDPFTNPLLIMYHLDTEIYQSLKYSKNDLIQNVKSQLKEISSKLNSEEQLLFHEEITQNIYDNTKSSKQKQKSSSSSSNSSSSDSKTQSQKNQFVNNNSKNDNNIEKQAYQIQVNGINSPLQKKSCQEYKKQFLSMKFEASQEQILNFRKNKTSSLSEINKKNNNLEESNNNQNTVIQESQIMEELLTPKSTYHQHQNIQTSFLGLTDKYNTTSPRQMNQAIETNSFDQSSLLTSPKSKVDRFVQLVQENKLRNFIQKKFQTILTKVKQSEDQYVQTIVKSSKRSFITDLVKDDLINQNIQQEEQEVSIQKMGNSLLAQRKDIKLIRDAMKSKVTIKANNISYFMIIISYISMVIIALIQKLQIDNNLNQNQINFQFLTIPYKSQQEISNIFRMVNLNTLLESGDFQKLEQIQYSTLKNDFEKYRQQNLKNLRDIINDADNSIQHKDLAQNVLQISTELVFTQEYYTKEKSNQIEFTIKESSFQISLIFICNMAFRYLNRLDSKYLDYFLYQNYVNIIQPIEKLEYQYIEQQINSVLDIKKNLQTLFLNQILINTIMIFIQIPIYYFHKKEQEKLLTLFGTFSTQTTNALIQKSYTNFYSLNRRASTVSKSVNQDFLENSENKFQSKQINQNEIKKTNVSEIIPIKKCSFKFAKKVILIYLMVIVFPCLSYYFTARFIDQTIIDINNVKKINPNFYFLAQVGKIRAQILDSLGSLILGLSEKLYPQEEDYFGLNELNKQRIQNILDNVNLVDIKLQSLQKNVTNSNFPSSDNYQSFLLDILQGDICQTLLTMPQYLNTADNIKIEECDQIYNSILNQGFLVSYKSLIDQMQDFYKLIFAQDNTTFLKLKDQLLQNFQIYSFQKFTDFLIFSLESIELLIVTIHFEYFDFLLNILSWLFAFQIVTITIFILFEQIYYFNKNQKKMNKLKSYLKVLDLESLTTNPFILKYFKQNIKQI